MGISGSLRYFLLECGVIILLGVLIVAVLVAYFCCPSSRTKGNDMPVAHIESWLRAFNLM